LIIGLKDYATIRVAVSLMMLLCSNRHILADQLSKVIVLSNQRYQAKSY